MFKAIRITLCAALALLASCGPTSQVSKAIPIAPTVPVPPKAVPVDLEPVKRGLGPVAESNRQLYEQIVTGKRSIYELNRQLKQRESANAATLEDWKRLTALGEETSKALDESEKIQQDQATAIRALESTVSTKTAEVAVADAQRAAVDRALEEANLRITGITGAHNDAVAEAQQSRERIAAVTTERDSARRTRNRAIGVAGVLLLSTAALAYLLFKP